AEPLLTETPDLRQTIKALSRVNVVASVYHIAEVWLVVATTVYASVIFVPLSSGVLGVVVFGGSRAALLLALYWFVPYCTFTQVFFRIRGAIEHGNVPDPGNPYQQTRTYFIHPALGFFFSPKQVNYHLEHHLYPSVPFYNLPRLHALLQQVVYPRERGYCEAFTESLRRLVGT
ncbi:MAG: fatty acid desaturase, partial [Deltaproteobacteria bacterium]|nr:fatty acid desaturase [Deltaproteobacteria bacterium]